MSKIEVKELTTLSGESAITLGETGKKIDVPSGATLDINSGATIINNGTATGFGGGGKVLQVVKGADSVLFSTASSSLVDSNVTVTITPTLASSVILLSYNAFYNRTGSGSGDSALGDRDITRDGTTIFSAFGGTSRAVEADDGFIYDAPNTTSAVTYKLRVARYDTWTVSIPAGCYLVS